MIFLTLILCTLSLSANFYEYFTDFFIAPIPTEYMAYKLLKKEEKLPTNYLAIPWGILIVKNKLDLVERLNLKLDGGCTVCENIYYERIIPLLKKIGIDTLFTPHADKESYDGIKIMPFPIYAINGASPSKNKDILYSFIGATSTHWSRKRILQIPQQQNNFIKERKNWHFSRDIFHPNCNTKEEQEAEKIEYQDILARSRFSLCPRGTGPNSIRFWESLQAGAIPILISDDMQLPKDFDWDGCIIRIKEDEVNQESIERSLRSISFEKETQMRKKCLEAFKAFSGDNFISPIIKHYLK